MDLPLYDIDLGDLSSENGMFRISLVARPAIEENFIHFNEEKIQFFKDEEKRQVVGPIMIPNKPIHRRNNEVGEYYIRFTEKAIDDIMYKYSKDGKFNLFNIEHTDQNFDGVTMLEIWKKESDADKSSKYGYNLPDGTVFVKAQIEDEGLWSSIKTGEPLPNRAAVITIDDGYQSVYDVAWPILQSYGYPFTVFLYVKATDRNYNDILNWQQILEMKAAGVEFQDHSYSHHRLGDWPKNMDESQYRKWIRDDLSRGRKILADKLGNVPCVFAIPYGEYNSIVLEEAISLGYDAILSQDPGSVSLDTNVTLIPREPILGNEWSGIEHFEKILNRVDMPIFDLEPPPTALSHPVVPRFGCRVKHINQYVPGTIGIYVSGLGWKLATIEGDSVYIDNDMPLPRHVSRVTVSGRLKENNRLAMRTWMLIQRPDTRIQSGD